MIISVLRKIFRVIMLSVRSSTPVIVFYNCNDMLSVCFGECEDLTLAETCQVPLMGLMLVVAISPKQIQCKFSCYRL